MSTSDPSAGTLPHFRSESSHLKMRKGTRSCFECRRRKTKCTYAEDSPSRCRECYARGSSCVDQDKVPTTTSRVHHASTGANISNGPGAKPLVYSLRERVARLEEFMDAYMRNENASAKADSGRSSNGQRTPVSVVDFSPCEPARYTADNSTGQSPVLSLFNNHVVTQIDGPKQHALATEVSTSATGNSRFHPERFELLNLLPQEPDLNTLVELNANWWSQSPHRFPELFEPHAASNIRSELSHKLRLPNPAETAKALLWTLISAERLPHSSFSDSTFQDPNAMATLGSRVLPVIDRTVVFNDDITTTLPGIECLILLSRYHCNQGRLRKAWHLSRRALEYCVSAGLNCISTYRSGMLPDQRVRQAKTWCAVCYLDRYLSMVLGFPYGVSDSYLLQPQANALLRDNPNSATFYVSLTSIIGHIIDRNQKTPEDSLFLTLKIDQELEDLVSSLDRGWWNPTFLDSYTPAANHERVEAYFLKHFIQALLHLPLMLKSPGKGVFQFSYDTAVESSRQAIFAYKLLRATMAVDPYLCTTLDFQAFTISVLLTLHLLGQKNDPLPRHTSDQNERDWKSVADTADILRQASVDSHNTVAKQAVKILDMLLRTRGGGDGPCPYGFDRGRWWKITIPCFGDITIGPGQKGPNFLGGCPSGCQSMEPPSYLSAGLQFSVDLNAGGALGPDQSNVSLNPAEFDIMTMSLDNIAAFPDIDWEV